jgi:hypothetical protein
MNRKYLAIGVVILLLLMIIAVALMANIKESTKAEIEIEESYMPPTNYACSEGPVDNNEPSVAVNPNDPNNIVAAANDYNAPRLGPGDSWVGYYTSHDGGKTWTTGFVPGYPGDSQTSELTGFRGAGDPVLDTNSEGDFYLAGIAFKRTLNPVNPIGFGWNPARANGIFVAKSNNGGDSFDQVSVVISALQSFASFHDKEWMAVDKNNGNVYICWSWFIALGMSQLLFSRSTDGGVSWSDYQIITEAPGERAIQGSAMVVDNNGVVHITWIDFDSEQLRYASSSDGGVSFSSPKSIGPVKEIDRYLSSNNYRTPTLTMLAVDNSESAYEGSLYCTWADISNGDPDILMVYSHDNGGTWSEPIRVNNDPVGNGLDQFFSAVAVSDEGFVHLVFYDKRNDENNTWIETYWAMSMDGGNNFTINLPISDEKFNGNYARDPPDGDREDFIGDYIGVVASNNSIHAVWCDTREGTEDTGDSEIYYVGVEYMKVLEDLDIEPVIEPEEEAEEEGE